MKSESPFYTLWSEVLPFRLQFLKAPSFVQGENTKEGSLYEQTLSSSKAIAEKDALQLHKWVVKPTSTKSKG